MKKLLILLIFIGVLIMLKPISAIIKDSIGNIMFRGNVVTGIVAKDNGNKSYDCYISESEVAYPRIFTLSRNPDLEVGDKVRILYKNGDRNNPIILPPTVVSDFIFVLYQAGGNYYLNRYTYNGVLSAELGVLPEIAVGNPYKMLVDSSNNVYIVSFNYPFRTLYKYDSNGKYIKEIEITQEEYGNKQNYFTLASDGYIYSMENRMSPTYINRIHKRNTDDLKVDQIYDITSGDCYYYYLTFDNAEYFYSYHVDLVDGLKTGYEKWKLGGGKVGFHKQANAASSYDSWQVAGDFIGCVASQYSADAYILDKSLSADRVLWNLTGISTLYRLTSESDYFICLGKSADNKLIMEKYSPERVRQEWREENKVKIYEVEIATSFTANLQYCEIAAYPF